MNKEIIKKIFEKHLEHDLFFDKKLLNVADDFSHKSFNTIPNKTIRIIHQQKKVNPSKIGKTLGIGKSTVTSTIDSLEDEGMVVRETDPNDRRKQWISLTQEGEAYHDDLIERITVNVAKISEKYGMELKDLEEYYDHLSKMVEILGKYMK